MDQVSETVADAGGVMTAALPLTAAAETGERPARRKKKAAEPQTLEEVLAENAKLRDEVKALDERFTALSERLAKLEVRDPIQIGRSKLEEMLEETAAQSINGPETPFANYLDSRLLQALRRWNTDEAAGGDLALRDLLVTTARTAAHEMVRNIASRIEAGNISGLQQYVRNEIYAMHTVSREAIRRHVG